MLVALDFETAPIAPGLPAPPPVCMSYCEESGASGVTHINDGALDRLRKYLEGDYDITGGNIAYDMLVAAAAEPDLLPLIFKAYDEDRVTDVLTRQKLIDIAMGEYRRHGSYSVANLSKRLLDKHMEKEDTWRLRYWELINTPVPDWPKEAVSYSVEDAIAPLEIFKAQEEGLREVGKEEVLLDQHRRARAALALALVSAWGLRTDREGVARLRTMCEDGMAELFEELFEKNLVEHSKKKGVPYVKKNVRKAQARLFESVGWEGKLTDTGKALKGDKKDWKQIKYLSVDEEACNDSDDPVMYRYSEYSKLSNLLTTGVKAMEGGVDVPLHTHFEEILETGRTSSSGPNVQNASKRPGVRECYTPRPGWVYLGCDFGKAELHTLAQCCVDLFGHSALADTLNAGIDPHTRLGARLAHCTYEELLHAVAAGDDEAIEWRSRAKPANFGFPGGMGPRGMRAYAKTTYDVILTLQEAGNLHHGWGLEYPDVAVKYLGWIRQLTSGPGYATIKHFQSERWRGRVGYCAAANSFFQGRAADAMLRALWAVIKECYMFGSPLYGCRVVNEVHDEFILEAPIAQANAAAWRLQEVMIREYNYYVKDVQVKATPVLMDRWSKKAKTIIENGELQIWRYAA